MKKTVFIILFMVAYVAISNAQFVVGGSLGFSTTGGSTDDGTEETDKPTSTSFNFYPGLGFIVSDNLWVGMQIGYGIDKTKTTGTPEVTNKATQFGFMPFVRYFAFRNNKFAIYTQGQVGVGFSSSETKTGDTTTDGPKNTGISFSVFPGLSYDVSDKVSLEAQINGLSLGYSYTMSTIDVAGTEFKDKTTGFDFGADLENILTTGFLTIGASIKF